MSGLRRAVFLGVCLLVALPALAAARPSTGVRSGENLVQVVVELESPSASRSVSRRLGTRLDLGARATLERLVRIEAEQHQVEGRIADAIPGAQIRWRYSVVLNGMAVLLPASAVSRLEKVEGVRAVHASTRYRPQLDRSPATVGAPALWGPGLENGGQGLKIGIIDDGIEHTHPFFNPSGYVMPPGFPRGQTAFTNAKVIVARSFSPPSPRYRFAHLAYDPVESEHGTHVAGIAAGNHATEASTGGGKTRLSGVAPRAYLGNYRVLTIPTISDVGLDGNSPEIAAGIEAAVRDGMDVINLSLGEPEIAPSRDLVARAIEGGAAAGVVPVISAGNDGDAFGRGSVSSPGSSPSAITVGAATIQREMAGFSAWAPTPLTLRMKPELSAPGVSILSAAPARLGSWQTLSGTSMAAPHVAGAAALLLQRHPSWTPAQVKSALTTTAVPIGSAPVPKQGSGYLDAFRANSPLVFAAPSSVSFGFVRRNRSITRRIVLMDAGGGAGEWVVSAPGLIAPQRVTVPGSLTLTLRARRLGDVSGIVVLARGQETRRIPFWASVTAPRLQRHPARRLSRTGTYAGNTRGRRALVSMYRYPENPSGSGIARFLNGPEQVFRIRLRRPAENLGVAILDQRRSVAVEPRIVLGTDENRQGGPTALPLNTNPYLPTFLEREPIAALIRPAAGVYSVVFDSRTPVAAGRFTFRYWVDDTTPPRLRLGRRAVRRGGSLRITAVDRGAGINPRSIFAFVDGKSRTPFYSVAGNRFTITISTKGLSRGRHRLELQVSDHQESKNMENTLRILPNTTRISAAFRVR